ncbi:hypothetical protein [uncultured Streptomyces sp.]|uniref:hypothetical protein n=1 Tax=uncultured Streptomyces sp. TaxID=174707 RepID=UPI0026318AE2|nr:hypothetical protein [uncultured Streptomyces sp.]
MTTPVQSLLFADAREAADLAAFLGRLLHYDRAAAVRLQADSGALAVFGRPPSFDVLAVRTARLGHPASFDVTVSAGELLESLAVEADEAAGADGADGPEESGGAGERSPGVGGRGTLPAPVTGPPWSGVLPPRGPWREVPGLPDAGELAAALAEAVAEFRARDTALPEERRTRAERDLIGRDLWSRTVGATGLPLRAVHAAQSLGFLRPHAGFPVTLLSAGPWLRLRTPYGAIALRPRTGAGLGNLAVSIGGH